MPAIDTSLFLAVNGLAGSSAALDAIGIFCGVWLIFLFPAAVVVRAAFLTVRRDPAAPVAIAILVRAAAASAVALLSKTGFAAAGLVRSRPYLAISEARRLVPEPHDAQSFPSGHAAVAFAIAFTWAFMDPKAARWLFPAAVLVALGRVYVGVHYPFDVDAGAVVGLIAALVARAVGRRFGDVEAVRRALVKF